MSEDHDIGQGSVRPKFHDEVNNTMTASTDVVTQFGTVRICWHEETVINIAIGPFDPGERRTSIRRFLPPHAGGQEVITKFMQYFIGQPTEFDVPLPPGVGTDAQRKIWSSLKSIPHGQSETYGQIAIRLGLQESQVRIIGNAVSQNPLPIIYPCHRAMAATGGLIGYSAEPHWKKALLEFEGVQIDYDKVRVPGGQ